MSANEWSKQSYKELQPLFDAITEAEKRVTLIRAFRMNNFWYCVISFNSFSLDKAIEEAVKIKELTGLYEIAPRRLLLTGRSQYKIVKEPVKLKYEIKLTNKIAMNLQSEPSSIAAGDGFMDRFKKMVAPLEVEQYKIIASRGNP